MVEDLVGRMCIRLFVYGAIGTLSHSVYVARHTRIMQKPLSLSGVVIGGQSRSSQEDAFQPPWEWVEHLWQQARASGCLLYWKPNLHTRPQEYPHA